MESHSLASRPAIPPAFGEQLRTWRQRRRLSQLDLAHEAQVSTRHLSCVETGRAVPSREMVLRLAERLNVPLRERNTMLVAAGYAPMYRERPLGDPALAAAREAVELLLKSHEPYPALAVDRHWNLVAYNALVPQLLKAVAPELAAPPVNVLRLSLHPRGLAPRIVNLGPWRTHLLERLHQQVQATGDPALAALLSELRSYPEPGPARTSGPGSTVDGIASRAITTWEAYGVAVPLQLRMEADTVLSFISTMTVFGSPVDITLQELAMETFFPADDSTREALVQMMTAASSS